MRNLFQLEVRLLLDLKGVVVSLKDDKSFFNLNTFICWHLISSSETTQVFSMSIKLGCDLDDTLKETCFNSNSEVLEIAFVIQRFL